MIIVELWGWREIFFAFSVPGIILSILWYYMVTVKPSDSKFCSPAEVEYIEKEMVPEVSDKSSVIRVRRDLGWLDKINRTKKIVPLKTVE